MIDWCLFFYINGFCQTDDDWTIVNIIFEILDCRRDLVLVTHDNINTRQVSLSFYFDLAI